MGYPEDPAISYSYTAFEQSQGNGMFPGQEIDVDLAALQQAIATINAYLKQIGRSDGKLQSGVVTKESLAADVRLGVDAPTPWETGVEYPVGATVFFETGFYVCATAHTAGVFNDDFVSGRWSLLADFASVTGDALTARAGAEAALDSFDDRYLGAKTSDPALDNDGDPLLTGALYWNSDTSIMRVYSGDGGWRDLSNNVPVRTRVYTATEGQTVFTGPDDSGAALLYDAGFESVYLNGVLLTPVADYERTNPATITLLTGASLDDTLLVRGRSGFTAVEMADLAASQTVSGEWNFAGGLRVSGQIVAPSAFGASLVDDVTDAAARATLGLGDLATQNILNDVTLASGSTSRPPSEAAAKTYVDSKAIGVGQFWQDRLASRTNGVAYQNTTGRTIMVSVKTLAGSLTTFEVSADGAAWVRVGTSGADNHMHCEVAVPAGHYYRTTGVTFFSHWAELR